MTKVVWKILFHTFHLLLQEMSRLFPSKQSVLLIFSIYDIYYWLPFSNLDLSLQLDYYAIAQLDDLSVYVLYTHY